MISWYIDSDTSVPPEALDGDDALEQRVDLGLGGVEVGRGARGRRHAVAAADGRGAVVADPARDAELVQRLADVVRVDAVDGEGDRGAAGRQRVGADDGDSVQAA